MKKIKVAGHVFARLGGLELMTSETSGRTFFSIDHNKTSMAEKNVFSQDDGGFSYLKLSAEQFVAAFQALVENKKESFQEEIFFSDVKPNILDLSKETPEIKDSNQPYKDSPEARRTRFGVSHSISRSDLNKLMKEVSETVLGYLNFSAKNMPRKNSKEEKEYKKQLSKITSLENLMKAF